MYQITRKHKPPRGTVTYTIYSREEADKEGLEYIDWREASPEYEGKVLTDDGYVADVISIKPYKNKYCPKVVNYEYYLPFTRRILDRRSNTKIEFMPHWETQQWGATPESWDRKVTRQAKWKAFAMAWSIMVLDGSVDYTLLGRIVDRYKTRPDIFAKNKMKNTTIKRMCMDALTELLESEGAGKKAAIENLLLSAKYAKEAKNSKDMLAVAKVMIELNGLEPARVTETRKIDGDFDTMLEGGGNVKGSIKGTQTIEKRGELDGGREEEA